MSRTGFLFHPASLEHDTGPAHPERASRAASVRDRVESSGLAAELDRREPGRADREALERVHDPAYVAGVETAIRSAPGLLDADTVVSPGSWEAALRAAGAAVEAVDRVESGEWRNAFVCARPPGHHAERRAAMGFCLFNNVAVAAAHLRARHGIERVAILDWDVHHGNGTQHSFEADPSVFYASLHQYPHYPGTGAASERGTGAGEGATLNCPLAAGTGDAEWLAALEQRVLPALEDFDPGFVLVSAGYDAHRDDPLSGTRVTTEAYRAMTRRLVELAAARCDGKLVALLEGGYDLAALADSVEVTLEELVAPCV